MLMSLHNIFVFHMSFHFLIMAQNESIHVDLVSFGHTFGVPKNVDLLYSIRHFPTTNVENYQQYDGRHKRIQNELFNHREYEELIQTITEQLSKYLLEHPTHSLRIAVGCEEGRHRSVAVIERLSELLRPSYTIEIHHRDLQRMKSEKHRQRERTTNRDRKYQ